MSKPLLKEAEALRKIELSLKLQGKGFKPDFISCRHCKFHWTNIEGGSPKYERVIWDSTRTNRIINPLPPPEKYNWHCFKYKGTPYHAYLRFRVIRTNAEGREVPIRGRWDTVSGKFTNEPLEGEKDTFVLKEAGTRWLYSVCRRFESSPRK